jgi:hypothetical protein
MEAVTITGPTLAEVADAVRARARAEWAEWDALVRHVDDGEARVRANDSHRLLRDAELSFVTTDLVAGPALVGGPGFSPGGAGAAGP